MKTTGMNEWWQNCVGRCGWKTEVHISCWK